MGNIGSCKLWKSSNQKQSNDLGEYIDHNLYLLYYIISYYILKQRKSLGRKMSALTSGASTEIF